MKTHFRTCPLCESTCGLELTVEGSTVTRIRGDKQDVFSRGYFCPKGRNLQQLHEDPDRLRRPRIRGRGEVGWDEAFDYIAQRWGGLIGEHGRDAVALYFGNPTAHAMGLFYYTGALVGSIGSRHVFSANTVDSVSKQVASGLMFGSAYSIAVPDIDRSSYLMIIGANPVVSNGSLWTTGGVPWRMRDLARRGGRIVVVDPRRTETAKIAHEHLAIRPGTDVYFLLALAHTLFAEDLVRVGLVEPYLSGMAELERFVADYSPERVQDVCRIPAQTIRRLARELAAAPAAAVYGRNGTSIQEFGTLCAWVTDVLNILTGNLDRPGGVMFPLPVSGGPNTWGKPGVGKGVRLDGPPSAVRGLPQVLGEYPAATMVDEMEAGNIRALITVAGNPVLSLPGGHRLGKALADLDLMISVDYYLNETSRLADVILPPPDPLQREHFDALLYRMAIRHVANYSPAVFPLEEGAMHEWEILSRLCVIATGGSATPEEFDERLAYDQAVRAAKSVGGVVTAEEVMAAVAPRTGPARLIDILLRSGPYGDAFGARPGGLSLDLLEANPHGLDYGPLRERVPEVLRTPSGKIEMMPVELEAELRRLVRALDREREGILLIGRRDVRTNNSWMNNLPGLARGRKPCHLHVHPTDAAAHALRDGAQVEVASKTGRIEATVHVTTDIMPGVVSLPHGWGHDEPDTLMGVAARDPGVNANVLTDPGPLDEISGNAVLNGVPVTLHPLPDRRRM